MLEVVALLTGRIRSTAREWGLAIALIAVAGILGLTAYGALLYAAGWLIAERAGPVAAALSIAGVTSLLAIILLLVVRARQARRRRLRRLRARGTLAAGTSAAAATLVPAMIRASPAGSLVAVAVLAYVVSRMGENDRRKR
ncbi:MAG: hypothetical protein KDJ87_02830 [Rhizobiaceae bacterium]|nr:hypothetical protein [Rhizobiaceae bacterium]